MRPWNEGYEVFARRSTGSSHPGRCYRARGVVLSGGVLGTVKLLMQCRRTGMLPGLSPQLGNYVRTNSESLLGVMSKDKSVDWNDQIAITSGIYAEATTHVEMVRYNKGSDVLLNLLTLLTDGGGSVPRGVRFLGNIVRQPYRFIRLLWPLGKAATTTVVLVMQTDENYLTLEYRPRWWRLGGFSLNSTIQPGQNRAPAYIPIANEVARRLGEKMNGIPLSFNEAARHGEYAVERRPREAGFLFNLAEVYSAAGLRGRAVRRRVLAWRAVAVRLLRGTARPV